MLYVNLYEWWGTSSNGSSCYGLSQQLQQQSWFRPCFELRSYHAASLKRPKTLWKPRAVVGNLFGDNRNTMAWSMCEVESPCVPGCTGLSYCSNLNDRPTEMYRACNSLADEAARRTVQHWQTGSISLPLAFTFDIPIKGTANYILTITLRTAKIEG